MLGLRKKNEGINRSHWSVGHFKACSVIHKSLEQTVRLKQGKTVFPLIEKFIIDLPNICI